MDPLYAKNEPKKGKIDHPSGIQPALRSRLLITKDTLFQPIFSFNYLKRGKKI